MCTSPIRIVNRTHHFDPYNSPLYFNIPCGKCQECKESYRNDWFVRCYYEWFLGKSRNSTFFYTLTFNNDNLPTFDGIPCFCRRVVQKFLKRLRHVLSKLGIRLRYMITCEFGERYHRPHLHALFFLDSYVNPYQFYKIVQDTWQQGFVQYGKMDMGLVKSTSGIRYVTKYVQKDISFMDEFSEKLADIIIKKYSLVDLFRRHGFLSTLTYYNGSFHLKPARESEERLCELILSRCRNLMYQHCPFHLQSTKLGLQFCEANPLADFCPIMQNGDQVLLYPLPRYFKRFFYYDVIENEINGKKTKFVLNEIGKRRILHHLNDSISRERSALSSVLLNLQNINEDTLKYVNGSTDYFTFSTVGDLRAFCRDFDLDLDILSIYSKCFRNRLCPVRFSDIPLTSKIVKDNYFDYVQFCLSECSTYDLGKIYQRDYLELNHLYSSSWNHHPFFRVFEFSLQILEAIDVSFRSQMSVCSAENESKTRLIRQLFNKPNLST